MPTEDRPEDAGGFGGEILNDPRHVRADARLVRRAIEERWPIPHKAKVELLKRLFKYVDEDAIHDGGRPSHREVIAAAGAILAADRMNLEQEKMNLAREKTEGTEEATVKAARDLEDAEADAETHMSAERPEAS